MASLSSSQATSRRRSSPSEQTASSQAGPSQSSTSPYLDSESDTLLLSSPSKHPIQSSQETDVQDNGKVEQAPTTPPREARICWICQQEDTDDTPETGEWRSPCPCSLTAHEECLLEWITSEEAPKKGEIAASHKIVCPVCKAEIHIERPTDYIVQVAELVQRAAKTMVLPTILSAIFGCVYSGFLVYGINTVQVVFGREEASNIIMRATPPRFISTRGVERADGFGKLLDSILPSSISKLMDPFIPGSELVYGWKLIVGLPMIAPALILSRFKIADPLFAILPVAYCCFPSASRDLLKWPPTPGHTFASLPYARQAYNELYRYTFADLEKQWDAVVQRKPREGETAEEIAAQQARDDNEGGPLEFDLQLEIVERGEGEEAVNVDNEEAELGGAIIDVVLPPPNPAINRPGVGFAAAAQNAAVGNQVRADANPGAGAGPAVHRNNNGWEVRHDISTTHISRTVMSALFFPAISSLVGDLLKHTLPSKWILKSSWMANGKGGLLQEKWGRTLIGGCLFVVLKDAVVLYCKWKKAKDFGKKKVLDYVKGK